MFQIVKTTPQSCSTLQRVLADTAAQLSRDEISLSSELESSKAAVGVLVQTYEEITRSIAETKVKQKASWIILVIVATHSLIRLH